MKILFLTRYGRLGASSRMRSYQFFPWFEKQDIECSVAPFFADNQLAERYQTNRHSFKRLIEVYWRRIIALLNRRNFDLLWIEKEALPWLPAWFEQLMLSGIPYVLDYDDAIFHYYDLHPSAVVRSILGRRADKLMADARLVVVGNEYLAQRARAAGSQWVEIVPTVIDLDRYSKKLTYNTSNGLLRIVWIGSPSTVHYLEMLREPLLVLSQRYTIQLRIVGASSLVLPGVNIEMLPWSEETEAELIRECDIGVMPLYETPWEQGKCGYKLIQYMACGLPVVASPVGVNCELVRSGVNGFLADCDQAWIEALECLLGNYDLRQQLGSAGRDAVEESYCLQRIAPVVAAFLRAAGTGS